MRQAVLKAVNPSVHYYISTGHSKHASTTTPQASPGPQALSGPDRGIKGGEGSCSLRMAFFAWICAEKDASSVSAELNLESKT